MEKKLFEDVIKWQEETFPSATFESKLIHLQEEVEELREDECDFSAELAD